MLKKLKFFLKKIAVLKITAIAYKSFRNEHNLKEKFFAFIDFLKDYKRYKNLTKNPNFVLKTADLYPRVFDKTNSTPTDPVYFYQGAWFAKKIFEAKPSRHIDIGSHAITIGIVSQFAPTTMVDMRPLPVSLPNLSFIKGTILELPFKNDEVKSLSSICVIEHIGLGRYGDPLDSFGSEKSADELARILAKNGDLYISVPVDKENITHFNAHRSFTRDYILRLFNKLKLVEEKYIYGNKIHDKYELKNGFGTGLYHFKKI